MDAKKDCDFSGWATKNDIRCSDGRTIRKDAFKHNDGQTVPLVWNHDHLDAENVLGHAVLENRDEGVYAYCFLNETENGRLAKNLVAHRDICSLSIYANQLQQNGGDVIHGIIREVSLVLAGANPQAFIENVMVHGDDTEGGAIIYNDEHELKLEHTTIDNQKEEVKMVDPINTPATPITPATPAAPTTITHSDPDPNAAQGKTVQEVYDGMTDEQKAVVDILVGEAVEEEKNNPNKEGKNMDGENTAAHNAFDPKNNSNDADKHELTHAEFDAILANARKTSCGSLRDAVKSADVELMHADPTYGISNVANLFPDAKALAGTPAIINRPQGWVKGVMGRVHHTPFSRVKSMAATLSEDECRARGYIKGKEKLNEVFATLKRTTDPQTVYKHQMMNRDDIIDITDFDVVAFIKDEMRTSLEEELARAFLIGDGRSSASDDKIDPLHIRPILGDSSTYVTKVVMQPKYGDAGSVKAAALIDELVRQRKNYKGAGNPIFYTTEDTLTEMLLLKDSTGRRIYNTLAELATAVRASDIIPVPVMEGISRTEGADTTLKTFNLLGILVDLADYNVGADKGGEVNMFEDFDIDFNQQKYLIETRCSGALVTPYSAITFEEQVAVAG